ncbi:hypothetical protein GOV13_00860 [Candidatus Pacearchaeota archaeon]|nr:hypothetical protein [Candidatus Pacearchaeota archaeon]
MKRGWEFLLVCVFLISFLSMPLVPAPNAETISKRTMDLDNCVTKCKANIAEEVDRSPCIIECKELYGFEEKRKEDLKCLDCGDGCFPAEKVAAMMCQPPTNGKPMCGVENGKCIVKGFDTLAGISDDFDEDKDYRCEDMAQDQCELIDACESIFRGPDCDTLGGTSGEVCPTVVFWEGCRYEGDEFFEEYKGEELKQEAGTTPGDTFYFIDKFFDKFGDQLDVKEERIAEIKAMVEAGDIEGAKVALEDYMKLAEELEHEIDPERKEEAKRSAAAIRATMKDIRDKLPEGERGKFVREVMSKEHSIATAAEISSKIKALCEQLAELDPMEYDKMCRAGEDAPQWQKKLHKDLSAGQEKTAREFVNIMKKCFKTSGQDCNCEAIPFYDFSIACSKAAPLATACDVEGDETACDDLENLKMPELPDWLQPIWEDLEDDMDGAQYDMHMPRECVEVGATTRNKCAVVMVKNNAPLECRATLVKLAEEGEVDKRVFERACDEIMMEQHAPQCAKKGITDPDECKRFMDSFRGPSGRKEDRPSQCNAAEFSNEECIEWIMENVGTPKQCKGLDGRQCRKMIIDAWGGPGKYELSGQGRGPDCMSIEDSMERLDCYDNKGNEFDDHYGPGPGEGQGEITWQCKENRIHWPPDCEIFMREEWPEQKRRKMEEGEMRREQEGDWRVMEKACIQNCENQGRPWTFEGGDCLCGEPGQYYGGPEKGFYDESECKDGCSDDCPGASRTDCVDGGTRCECFYEDKEPEHYEEDYDNNVVENTEGDSGGTENNVVETDGTSDGGSSDNVVETTTETSESSSSEGAEITGNAFLDYYNR